MGTTGWGPDHPARHADAAAVTELDLSLAAAVDIPLVEQNRSEGVRQLGNERDPCNLALSINDLHAVVPSRFHL